ncbi:MAG: Holliday junction branch migration protein RuvA [Candidatus Euphemobacter frigidus]|nr:Holliday junction branch migration protein RuvA [Candidatus Euphemobacter frigidus]MDP8275950.1 Holliday junction branch migration protein RuvA [Candidatus Euphemobacter frigidus]
MIDYLKGRLIKSAPDYAVVEVNGIGYRLLIPVSTFEKLPAPGPEITILTHLYVREDEQTLYGFTTEEERGLFLMLLGVSRIGPKVALGVLGGLPVSAFKSAVASGNVDLLSAIHGIGKKTAERLILELKDKITLLPRLRKDAGKIDLDEAEEKVADVMRALLSLGYRQMVAHKALTRALAAAEPDWPVERLLKESLRYI